MPGVIEHENIRLATETRRLRRHNAELVAIVDRLTAGVDNFIGTELEVLYDRHFQAREWLKDNGYLAP